MKNLIYTFSLLALFLFIAGTVESADPLKDKKLTGDEIETLARNFLINNMTWDKDQMSVDVSYDGPDISVSEGNYKLVYRLGGNKKKVGKFTLGMWVKVDDEYQHRLRLKTIVKLFYDVVQLRHPIKRNQELTEADLESVRIESSKQLRNNITNTEEAVGFKLTRNMGQGEYLTLNMLKKTALVKNGDRVILIVEKGALRITAPGVVKENGFKNSTVKAINAESKKIVYGKVIDENTLKVIF